MMGRNFVTELIEGMEAAGQRGFVANNTLPIECNFCKREDFEDMGIVYGKPVNYLFVEVQLPAGWKKVATDHSMWNDLVDDAGVVRANIFYKAAFYDERAFIGLAHG